MPRTEAERPYVHYLSLGGLDLDPLCKTENAPKPRGAVTAHIERITCPDCIRILNMMLAGTLNQHLRKQ